MNTLTCGIPYLSEQTPTQSKNAHVVQIGGQQCTMVAILLVARVSILIGQDEINSHSTPFEESDVTDS